MRWLRGWFPVRPSEWRGVTWFFALFGVLSLGATVARSVAFTLLVGEYGRDVLPVVFIIVDLCVTAGSLAYLRWSRGRTAVGILFLFLGFAALFSLLATFLFEGQVRGAALFWFVGFFALHVLTIVHLGTLLATYYDAAQQKRLSGLVYAGMPVGGMAGGALLMPLLQMLQPVDLVPVLALTSALGMGVAWYLGRNLSPLLREDRRRSPGVIAELRGGAGFVRSSALLRWMALGVALFVVASKVLEFQYHGLIYPAAYPDLSDRTAFFGRYEIVANGLWLLIQILFSSRILVRLGVGGSNLAHPALLIVASFGLVLHFGLVAGLIAQFVNQEMRGAIRAPAQALLFNGVPPDRWATSKTFINGLVFPLATLVAGLVLIALQAVLSAEQLSLWLPLLTLSLAVAGLLAGLPQWRAYRRSVLGMLACGQAKAGRDPEKALSLALRGDDPVARLVALEQVARLRSDALLPAVGRLLLSIRDRDCKRQCARTLASFAESDVALGYLLRALRFESDAQVLVPLLEQLGAMVRQDTRSAVTRFLLHPAPGVFAAAVQALMANRHFSPGPGFSARVVARLETRDATHLPHYLSALAALRDESLAERCVRFQGHDSADVRVAAYRARAQLLRARLDDYRDDWLQALGGPDREVRRIALEALEECRPLADWGPVIARLAARDRGESAAAAELLRRNLSSAEPSLWSYTLAAVTPPRGRRAALALLREHLKEPQRLELRRLLMTRLVGTLRTGALADDVRLRDWGEVTVRPYLLRVLAERREREMEDALGIAAGLSAQGSDFVERIRAGLRDGGRHRRGLVLEAVAECGEKGLGPELQRLIEAETADPAARSSLYREWAETELEPWLADRDQALAGLSEPGVDEVLAYRRALAMPSL